MKRIMLKILIIVAIIVALVFGGKLLYKHFVTDRIADWGGMENPDAQMYTDQEE